MSLYSCNKFIRLKNIKEIIQKSNINNKYTNRLLGTDNRLDKNKFITSLLIVSDNILFGSQNQFTSRIPRERYSI